MDKRGHHHIGPLLIYFSLMVLTNWTYANYMKYMFITVNSAWFKVLPVLGFFYFAFAVISLYYIYRRESIGFALGCTVILFGVMADVLSYVQVNQYGTTQGLLLTAMIIANAAVVILMARRVSLIKKR